jgi:hypothetical protein
MKEFQFKKKLKESNYENNLQIIKEKEEKELNEFESSLKKLSKIEISNLKSEFEKKISKYGFQRFFLVVFFFFVLTQIISRYVFNSPILPSLKWYIELAMILGYFEMSSGLRYKEEDSKKKLELINKFK